MQVEAIYHQGRLEFVTPLRLKPEPLRVVVDVPDAAVETGGSSASLPPANPPSSRLPPQVIGRATAMREALDAIRNAPPPADDELAELSDKQRQRLDAFALREDR